MRDVILETEHLTKIFSSEKGGFTAVHDVSFEIGKGEALGIVGDQVPERLRSPGWSQGFCARRKGRSAFWDRILPKRETESGGKHTAISR